jgi:hypothetical protein
VPADWGGQKLSLWFGYLPTASAVYVNGKALGHEGLGTNAQYWKAYCYPSDKDVSALLRYGETNVIVIRANYPVARRGWILGGETSGPKVIPYFPHDAKLSG